MEALRWCLKQEGIRQISAEYPYLVVEADGKVQGYAYAHAFIPRKAYQFCCELTIYLDKDARHQGLGRALYTALEEELRQRGFRRAAEMSWEHAADMLHRIYLEL